MLWWYGADYDKIGGSAAPCADIIFGYVDDNLR